MVPGSGLRLAGNLLKHPADITNNQVEGCKVHTQGESVSPPTEAEYHQECTVRTAMLEVVEGEVIWEGVVDRWPILASGWLDG